MVGLVAVTNKKLLKEICSRHPNGIYSSDDFKAKMKKGTDFFHLSAGEGGIGLVSGPYTFVHFRKHEIGLCYVVKGDDSKHFVNDLFYGVKACFALKDEAEAYRKELLEHSEKLHGMI